MALYVLYATRTLELSPLLIGLIFAAGGAGAIPGAILADRYGERFGVGRTIIFGFAFAGVGALVLPLASGSTALVVAVLMIGKAFAGITETAGNIHQWTLRQTVTPDRLAGRVTAGHRFVVYGACAVGAVAGGVAGSAIGVRNALVLLAVGMIVSPLIGVFSPLRNLRRQPADVERDGQEAGHQPEQADAQAR